MKKKTLMALALCSMVVSAPAFAEEPEEGVVTTTAVEEQSCETDADCGEGFLCQEIASADCAAAPCAEGEECPDVQCEPSASSKMCVPAPPPSCESDADCSGGLKCVTFTQSSCSGASPGAEPGTSEGSTGSSEGSEGSSDGTETSPAECQEETVGYCLPPYLAPCAESADCGPGFECAVAEVCSCSGSAGTVGSSEGGEAGEGTTTDPGTEECSCEPTGDKYCKLLEVACESDESCTDGFVCQSMPAMGDAMATCTVSDTGERVCEETEGSEPAPEQSYCVPPDWATYGNGPSVATGAGSPRNDSQEVGSPATGGEGPTNTSADSDKSSSSDSDDGGCSTTGSGSSAPIGLLGLAAAWFIGRVRRRR